MYHLNNSGKWMQLISNCNGSKLRPQPKNQPRKPPLMPNKLHLTIMKQPNKLLPMPLKLLAMPN